MLNYRLDNYRHKNRGNSPTISAHQRKQKIGNEDRPRYGKTTLAAPGCKDNHPSG